MHLWLFAVVLAQAALLALLLPSISLVVEPLSRGITTALPSSMAQYLLKHNEKPQPYGPYSNYCPLEPYASVPQCRVDQVSILQRHGARYPTDGASERIQAALAKLKSVRQEDLDRCFSFLPRYTFDLGLNDLLPLGQQQAYDAGHQVYRRYTSLASSHQQLPFVRASSSERVVASAKHWIEGFKHHSRQDVQDPLILLDDPHMNNTLSNHGCPAYDFEPLFEALHLWAEHSGARAAKRLNRRAPGANLTAFDFVHLAEICPLETAAYGVRSPFCDVFTREDWQDFEFYHDVQKYYFTGPGHRLGRAQGTGYVTELLSRLTGSHVSDDTQTNRTLNGNPETFPFDRPIYADFTHDNQQMSIFAAMGLIDKVIDPAEPSCGHPSDWMASCLVPFASRMAVERLQCSVEDGPEETWVRLMINERILRLEPLHTFVHSQEFSVGAGQQLWRECGHQATDVAEAPQNPNLQSGQQPHLRLQQNKY